MLLLCIWKKTFCWTLGPCNIWWLAARFCSYDWLYPFGEDSKRYFFKFVQELIETFSGLLSLRSRQPAMFGVCLTHYIKYIESCHLYNTSMYKIIVYVSIPVIVYGNVCVAVLNYVSVLVSVFGSGERRMGRKLLHMHFYVVRNHHYHTTILGFNI